MEQVISSWEKINSFPKQVLNKKQSYINIVKNYSIKPHKHLIIVIFYFCKKYGQNINEIIAIVDIVK